MFPVIPGVYETDHKAICKLARLSPYSKGFCDVRFIQEYYKEGWIGVVRMGVLAPSEGLIVGFICLRHCKRKPHTSVYYMGVHPGHQRKGLASLLLNWAILTSPHHLVELNSEMENVSGRRLYEKLGFVVYDTGANKHGVKHYCFRKEW